MKPRALVLTGYGAEQQAEVGRLFGDDPLVRIVPDLAVAVETVLMMEPGSNHP